MLKYHFDTPGNGGERLDQTTTNKLRISVFRDASPQDACHTSSWPPFPSRRTMRKHSPDAATIVSMPPIIIDPALFYPSDNHVMQRPGCIEPSPSWHITPNNNLIPPLREQFNIANNVPYVSNSHPPAA